MVKQKYFTVTVVERWPGMSETQCSDQILKIMDVPGYSHIKLGSRRNGYHAGMNFTAVDVILVGTGKGKLQQAVKAALGKDYWQGYHYVNPAE